MLAQRALWGGGTLTSLVMGVLAFIAIDKPLPQYAFTVVFGVLFLASMLMFPWRETENGTLKRGFQYIIQGRHNPSFLAAGDSTVTGTILVTGKAQVHQHGMTVDQIGELKKHVDEHLVGEVERYVDRRMEAFKLDVVNYTGQANDQAILLGRQLITDFVAQLAARAPENLESLKTVDMQQAILNAQTSAAIAGDEDLTETLVDILVDKSGAEPRSFKGVVLTEALQVAGKLTADQVNLLTAILALARTVVHDLDTVDLLLASLAARCEPLYGKVPTSNSALQYMSYTGVGDIERTQMMLIGPGSIADTLVSTYDSVLTRGFVVEDLPEPLRRIGEKLPPVDSRIAEGRFRFPVASSQTIDKLAQEGQLNEPYAAHAEEVKNLIESNRVPGSTLMEILEEDNPQLAQFLHGLDKIGASSFQLSSVGIAIGQANWRRLLPEDAPEVDIWLG